MQHREKALPDFTTYYTLNCTLDDNVILLAFNCLTWYCQLTCRMAGKFLHLLWSGYGITMSDALFQCHLISHMGHQIVSLLEWTKVTHSVHYIILYISIASLSSDIQENFIRILWQIDTILTQLLIWPFGFKNKI